MFNVYYFVIVSLIVTETLGDTCRLPSGGNGECIELSRCVPVLQSLQRGFRPAPCGFKGIAPLVCCPTVTETTTVNSQPRPTNLKSDEMCEYYKKIADRPIFGIVNGLPAEAGEFPHMVALGFGEKDDIRWSCGGTLISDKFVVTAAHCVSSAEFGPVRWARTGTINLRDPEKGGFPQDFEIINRHRHPDYKPPSRYNDIAVLELNDTIEYTKYVRPACLNTELDIFKDVQAIGWGLVELAGDASNDLLKVGLEVYRQEVCNKSYSNISKRLLAKGIVHEWQVCAGGAPDESKDTCQGDSGGPLHRLIKDSFSKVYSLIGVTSFGKGCGIVNIPGVYTRVSRFVPWIESIVWPQEEFENN